MFDDFTKAFAVSSRPAVEEAPNPGPTEELSRLFGGCTFNQGLYRVHTSTSAASAAGLVAAAFPDFAGRIDCFAFDWLGRQFSLDRQRGSADDPEVLMFEPGSGEALEIPVPFSAFHDEELVNYADEALATKFFAEWRSSGGSPVAFDQCVGYRVPLFLGGQDGIGNLELSDIDVYWGIFGQLRLGTVNLPEGTKINRVDIAE